MKRIMSELKQAENTRYAKSNGDLELGLAVMLTYKFMDHVITNQYSLFSMLFLKKISQDLGGQAFKNIFFQTFYLR